MWRAISGKPKRRFVVPQPREAKVDQKILGEPTFSAGLDVKVPLHIGRDAIVRTFDGTRPVKSRSELFGRRQEIETLVSAVLDAGQHAIIHGARGSGKTSVAKIFGSIADQRDAIVSYLPCEPNVLYAELMRSFLNDLPRSAVDPELRARFEAMREALPDDFGPRAFGELVAGAFRQPTIFILDEFDQVLDSQTLACVAITMKMLSDIDSRLVFVLVGIGRNLDEIIANHMSLRRHMHSIRLGRIDPTSVDALIDAGEAATGLKIDQDARALINRVSCGSPYHVRTICRQAALAADRGGRNEVNGTDMLRGIEDSVAGWSTMNGADAAHFDSLVERGAHLRDLERLARAVAEFDEIEKTAETTPVIELLEGAMQPVASSEAHYSFVDSLAPQFLISKIVLAENASHSQGEEAYAFSR